MADRANAKRNRSDTSACFMKPGVAFNVGLAVLSVVLISACAADSVGDSLAPQPSAQAPSRATEASLQTQILKAIGYAACSEDSQCHVLPLGAKACGGPTSWLAHSETAGSAVRLSTLADQLADLQRNRDEKSGVVSNCQYLPAPAASCKEGRCQLRAPSTLVQ